MPEPCDENSEAFKAGYKTIADIAKERIRRVIRKIQGEPIDGHSRETYPREFLSGNGNPEGLFKDTALDSRLQTAGMTDEHSNDSKIDPGFKVFKLSPSNFKMWRGSEIDNGEKLLEQLDAFTDPVRPGAEKENMLYELMLKAGYELTSKVEYVTLNPPPPNLLPQGERENKASRHEGFYSINNNELIIALDSINESLVEQIINLKPQKVITLDSLFSGNDQLKTNTVLQMRDAGIDFKTI